MQSDADMLDVFGLGQCLISGLMLFAMQPVSTRQQVEPNRLNMGQECGSPVVKNISEHPTCDESVASDFSRKHPG